MRTSGIRSVIVLTPLLLLAGGPACSRRSAEVESPRLSTAITFRCLWWSAEQMNGLDPNAPPPKTTEVILKRWEYSDPIGVPNPDVVDLVVEVRNDSERTASELVINVATAWRVGPLEDEKRAQWGEPASVQRTPPFRLASRETRTLRVPVDVAQKMKELRSSESWPWTLRAQVTVTRTGSTAVLSSTQADLPITPGN